MALTLFSWPRPRALFSAATFAGGGGHWVTLHPHGHTPGTPDPDAVDVFVSTGGVITKGPKSLVSQHIGHIASHPSVARAEHHKPGVEPAGARSHPTFTEMPESARAARAAKTETPAQDEGNPLTKSRGKPYAREHTALKEAAASIPFDELDRHLYGTPARKAKAMAAQEAKSTQAAEVERQNHEGAIIGAGEHMADAFTKDGRQSAEAHLQRLYNEHKERYGQAAAGRAHDLAMTAHSAQRRFGGLRFGGDKIHAAINERRAQLDAAQTQATPDDARPDAGALLQQARDEAKAAKAPAASPAPVSHGEARVAREKADASKGHVAHIGTSEYYKGPNGDLYRAPRANPIGTDGYRQGGRFEATAGQADAHVARLQAAGTPTPAAPTYVEPRTVANPIDHPDVDHAALSHLSYNTSGGAKKAKILGALANGQPLTHAGKPINEATRRALGAVIAQNDADARATSAWRENNDVVQHERRQVEARAAQQAVTDAMHQRQKDADAARAAVTPEQKALHDARIARNIAILTGEQKSPVYGGAPTAKDQAVDRARAALGGGSAPAVTPAPAPKTMDDAFHEGAAKNARTNPGEEPSSMSRAFAGAEAMLQHAGVKDANQDQIYRDYYTTGIDYSDQHTPESIRRGIAHHAGRVAQSAQQDVGVRSPLRNADTYNADHRIKDAPEQIESDARDILDRQFKQQFPGERIKGKKYNEVAPRALPKARAVAHDAAASRAEDEARHLERGLKSNESTVRSQLENAGRYERLSRDNEALNPGSPHTTPLREMAATVRASVATHQQSHADAITAFKARAEAHRAEAARIRAEAAMQPASKPVRKPARASASRPAAFSSDRPRLTLFSRRPS